MSGAPWSRGQSHLGDGLRDVVEGVNLVVVEDNSPPLLLRQLLFILRLRTSCGNGIVRMKIGGQGYKADRTLHIAWIRPSPFTSIHVASSRSEAIPIFYGRD